MIFKSKFAKSALPLAAIMASLAGCASTATANEADAAMTALRSRVPAEEVIYFVLPDRFENGDPSNDTGGIKGDRLQHGFDPAHKGFYHGGDLKGLIQRLDYIQGMGVTAIWFAPIFKNKPVQGPKGDESAGYHGYWVTDFTSVDPHFGTNADFKTFVDAAHKRGMKVYMDIITNHTADVIKYAEGEQTGYRYRSRGDFPYSRKGGLDGRPINTGFQGDGDRSPENFAKLSDPSYAYTPIISEAEKNIKKPEWLNDPIYYHNRGDSTFTGESSRHGDFVGLDDVFTEHPRVVDGLIDVYKSWIERFGVDGYRVDTARHVNPEFWQKFVPAMLDTAKAKGIPNFHIFGEVYRDTADNGYIAQYTRRDGFPAVLDFAFQMAVRETVGRGKGTFVLNELFDGDVLYEGGEASALNLPTFLGNHDMGRLPMMLKQDIPSITEEELLNRVKLAHVMLMSLRGSPTIYSGDEQGFVGDGNDQAAREDMFPSKTASYNDNQLIGTNATTADSNFDQNHVLYKLIAQLAALRKAHPALAKGKQLVRHYGEKPGIFAVSRFDPNDGREYLIVHNTSNEPQKANIMIESSSAKFASLYGQCASAAAAPGSISIALPALGSAICMAESN
jgi:neopullulanase